MKKIISLLSLITLVICSIALHAQITITDSDIHAASGDLFLATDTNPAPSITVGGMGSGQTWDFSALQNHELDTASFLSPSGIPKASDFPSANLVITFGEDSGRGWTFLENSAAELKTLGFVEIEEIDGPSVLDTFSFAFQQVIISFPSMLNTSFNRSNSLSTGAEEFGFDPDGPGPHPIVDSIETVITSTTNSNMEAEGALTIPTGSFTALRQRSETIQIDSIFMYSSGAWTLISPTFATFLGEDAVTADTTLSYRWWTNNATYGFPLVELEVDRFSLDAEYADWLNVTPTGISANEDLFVLPLIYPNPASNTVSIEHKGYTNGTIEIFDLSGRKIQTHTIKNEISKIDVQELTNGSYILRLLDQGKQIIHQGKLHIRH